MKARALTWLVACILGTALAFEEYILIVDAGSSGSRLRIFGWDIEAGKDLYAIEGEEEIRSKPGISSLSPTEAAKSIRGLLEQATEIVPQDRQSNTSLHILATAGMRLLDDSTAVDIWEAIRKECLKGPFDTKNTATLSGEAEGAYGYFSVNYLKKSFNKTMTYGSLDLGGASTQISFKPRQFLTMEFHKEKSETVKNDRDSSVFSHSWMRSGQDEAHLRLLRAECGANQTTCSSVCHMKDFQATYDLSSYGGEPKLEVTGTGDWNACYELVKDKLLHLDYECLLPPCAMHGVHVARPPQGMKFYASSAFFYSLNGVGAVDWSGSSPAIDDYLMKGTEWCSGLGAINGTALTADPGFAALYCFGSAYSYAILKDAYGFNSHDNISTDDTAVIVTRKVEGTSVGWAIGAALAQTPHMRDQIAQPLPSACEPQPLPSACEPIAPESDKQQSEARKNLGNVFEAAGILFSSAFTLVALLDGF